MASDTQLYLREYETTITIQHNLIYNGARR